MIELRDYQKEAIKNLHAKVEKALMTPENKVVIFQAPTGSGKTLMVSEMLKKLVRDRKNDQTFSFVWVSVRMLHEQSKEKLEKYYEDDRLIQCSYFDDLEDRKIGENEILFINWHSINKKDINIFVRENEQDNNLNSIIRNTKEEGREIIMIIDESHHTASSEKSRELIEVISPKVTLEVSATPHLTENVFEIERVSLSEVKDEEMIKSEISVNPEFSKKKIGDKSADELVIESALLKRKWLQLKLKEENTNINPLVLIQLPDKREGMDDKKISVINILEEKFDITEKNEKLAIWLSEQHSDALANIEKNDNKVEVLIFKQAIALGWDCPRASILVIFRESKSFTFTIQTIGRIMRMPELKYYNEPELNKGFVFTNLSNIEITEDYAKDYITIYEAKRDSKLYNDVSIPSIYLKRQRERTRLSGKFVNIFFEVAEEYGLDDKIDVKPSRIINPIMSDGRIVDVDKAGEIEHKGTIDIELNEKELSDRFDRFIAQACSPYAPVDSSDRMKTAIYLYIKQKFKIDKYDPKAQMIVLSKENYQVFINVINLAKERFRTDVIEKLSETREVQPVEKWEVPPLISYNSNYKKKEKDKSIMKPFYAAHLSEPEEDFIELMESSDKVKWWFRNSHGEIKYFAIPYKDKDGFERAFYIDFIVMMKDGRIGLFDTKSGFTAELAKERAEALARYIKEQNKKREKKLWGGIVTFKDGSCRYNDSESYGGAISESQAPYWKILSFK
ncbi:MAG: DEAD/DEAH box helicase family protein [Candidatus Omnitrophica bacterium]|nr:DEAD/DEAH box helicase family protein [Candidatus Omnitrophota bacterium]